MCGLCFQPCEISLKLNESTPNLARAWFEHCLGTEHIVVKNHTFLCLFVTFLAKKVIFLVALVCVCLSVDNITQQELPEANHRARRSA